ncbi:DNA/RNA polymerases superfamily protein, partial [Tanacetum coccineum]
VRSRGSDFDIPVVFLFDFALLRNKFTAIVSTSHFLVPAAVSKLRAGIVMLLMSTPYLYNFSPTGRGITIYDISKLPELATSLRVREQDNTTRLLSYALWPLRFFGFIPSSDKCSLRYMDMMNRTFPRVPAPTHHYGSITVKLSPNGRDLLPTVTRSEKITGACWLLPTEVNRLRIKTTEPYEVNYTQRSLVSCCGFALKIWRHYRPMCSEVLMAIGPSMRINLNLMLQIKEAQGTMTLREKVMTEAHSSPFTIHPGSTKMYRDLKQYFWWNGMKQDVATFVSKCMTCQQVKIEHQRASGLLQPLEIPMWKWDEISMDFVTGLPTTQKRHDAIWVVEIVRLHGTPTSIVSDRDPKFTSHFWKGLQKAWGTRLKFSTAFHPQTDGQSERTIQTLEDMLRACALEWTGSWDEYLCLVEFAYNNSWHASIKAAPFELLYGRKCRAPICWDEVGERLIEGPELIEITNEKAGSRARSSSFIVLEFLERIGEVRIVGSSLRSYRTSRCLSCISLRDTIIILACRIIPLIQIQPDMSLSEEPDHSDRQERFMKIKSFPFVKYFGRITQSGRLPGETEDSMLSY